MKGPFLFWIHFIEQRNYFLTCDEKVQKNFLIAENITRVSFSYHRNVAKSYQTEESRLS